MKLVRIIVLSGILYLRLVFGEINKEEACGFPAIYNFGDSNSDTGGKSAAFHEVQPPNADRLDLPYLSAYLDSIGADFRNGANFATVGSSILPGGYSPFYLGVQISQFLQFKKRTILLSNLTSCARGRGRGRAHPRAAVPAVKPRVDFDDEVPAKTVLVGPAQYFDQQSYITPPAFINAPPLQCFRGGHSGRQGQQYLQLMA
uniref:GDSL esterase/lipase At5g14450-like n=1 Tax=Nicotiana sylvestris TaxID=4096 RepID=A0A1U7V825_NICSY|nr:PREDICTED: GDSL esterase/lipase At5g14450-like [Nicotiana sylvestris]